MNDTLFELDSVGGSNGGHCDVSLGVDESCPLENLYTPIADWMESVIANDDEPNNNSVKTTSMESTSNLHEVADDSIVNLPQNADDKINFVVTKGQYLFKLNTRHVVNIPCNNKQKKKSVPGSKSKGAASQVDAIKTAEPSDVSSLHESEISLSVDQSKLNLHTRVGNSNLQSRQNMDLDVLLPFCSCEVPGSSPDVVRASTVLKGRIPTVLSNLSSVVICDKKVTAFHKNSDTYVSIAELKTKNMVKKANSLTRTKDLQTLSDDEFEYLVQTKSISNINKRQRKCTTLRRLRLFFKHDAGPAGNDFSRQAADVSWYRFPIGHVCSEVISLSLQSYVCRQCSRVQLVSESLTSQDQLCSQCAATLQNVPNPTPQSTLPDSQDNVPYLKSAASQSQWAVPHPLSQSQQAGANPSKHKQTSFMINDNDQRYCVEVGFLQVNSQMICAFRKNGVTYVNCLHFTTFLQRFPWKNMREMAESLSVCFVVAPIEVARYFIDRRYPTPIMTGRIYCTLEDLKCITCFSIGQMNSTDFLVLNPILTLVAQKQFKEVFKTDRQPGPPLEYPQTEHASVVSSSLKGAMTVGSVVEKAEPRAASQKLVHCTERLHIPPGEYSVDEHETFTDYVGESEVYRIMKHYTMPPPSSNEDLSSVTNESVDILSIATKQILSAGEVDTHAENDDNAVGQHASSLVLSPIYSAHGQMSGGPHQSSEQNVSESPEAAGSLLHVIDKQENEELRVMGSQQIVRSSGMPEESMMSWNISGNISNVGGNTVLMTDTGDAYEYVPLGLLEDLEKSNVLSVLVKSPNKSSLVTSSPNKLSLITRCSVANKTGQISTCTGNDASSGPPENTSDSGISEGSEWHVPDTQMIDAAESDPNQGSSILKTHSVSPFKRIISPSRTRTDIDTVCSRLIDHEQANKLSVLACVAEVIDESGNESTLGAIASADVGAPVTSSIAPVTFSIAPVTSSIASVTSVAGQSSSIARVTAASVAKFDQFMELGGLTPSKDTNSTFNMGDHSEQIQSQAQHELDQAVCEDGRNFDALHLKLSNIIQLQSEKKTSASRLKRDESEMKNSGVQSSRNKITCVAACSDEASTVTHGDNPDQRCSLNPSIDMDCGRKDKVDRNTKCKKRKKRPTPDKKKKKVRMSSVDRSPTTDCQQLKSAEEESPVVPALDKQLCCEALTEHVCRDRPAQKQQTEAASNKHTDIDLSLDQHSQEITEPSSGGKSSKGDDISADKSIGLSSKGGSISGDKSIGLSSKGGSISGDKSIGLSSKGGSISGDEFGLSSKGGNLSGDSVSGLPTKGGNLSADESVGLSAKADILSGDEQSGLSTMSDLHLWATSLSSADSQKLLNVLAGVKVCHVTPADGTRRVDFRLELDLLVVKMFRDETTDKTQLVDRLKRLVRVVSLLKHLQVRGRPKQNRGAAKERRKRSEKLKGRSQKRPPSTRYVSNTAKAAVSPHTPAQILVDPPSTTHQDQDSPAASHSNLSVTSDSRNTIMDTDCVESPTVIPDGDHSGLTSVLSPAKHRVLSSLEKDLELSDSEDSATSAKDFTRDEPDLNPTRFVGPLVSARSNLLPPEVRVEGTSVDNASVEDSLNKTVGASEPALDERPGQVPSCPGHDRMDICPEKRSGQMTSGPGQDMEDNCTDAETSRVSLGVGRNVTDRDSDCTGGQSVRDGNVQEFSDEPSRDDTLTLVVDGQNTASTSSDGDVCGSLTETADSCDPREESMYEGKPSKFIANIESDKVNTDSDDVAIYTDSDESELDLHSQSGIVTTCSLMSIKVNCAVPLANHAGMVANKTIAVKPASCHDNKSPPSRSKCNHDAQIKMSPSKIKSNNEIKSSPKSKSNAIPSPKKKVVKTVLKLNSPEDILVNKKKRRGKADTDAESSYQLPSDDGLQMKGKRKRFRLTDVLPRKKKKLK